MMMAFEGVVGGGTVSKMFEEDHMQATAWRAEPVDSSSGFYISKATSSMRWVGCSLGVGFRRVAISDSSTAPNWRY
ncbi:hypothetical protein B296_00001479 [Ensete ventricosum]|uniref:Uncharacterized protein n=1 Tax=Ensete ventricosum TaxID=4639 RepID=A0A427A0G1_ENSVE|nr:hypothetical protein B296_00001479 [Ensete ventricosum]